MLFGFLAKRTHHLDVPCRSTVPSIVIGTRGAADTEFNANDAVDDADNNE